MFPTKGYGYHATPPPVYLNVTAKNTFIALIEHLSLVRGNTVHTNYCQTNSFIGINNSVTCHAGRGTDKYFTNILITGISQ